MESAEVVGSRGKRGRLLPELVLIWLGIALNVALGLLVHRLRLPLYFDAIGTIVVTLLVGLRAGIIVGVLSALLNGLVTDPLLPYFAGTQVVIALYVHLAGRQGWFETLPKTLLAGLVLGVVGAVISAPVAAYLFGGVTGYGASALVSLLLKAGESVYRSVVLSGLTSEPVDKIISCLLAFGLLRALPPGLLRRFVGGSLGPSNFLRE